MKTLVVFDSTYGNTEKIARAIGEAMVGEVRVLRVGEVQGQELDSIDMLIVGSPTHGGRPTPAIQDYVNKLSSNTLKGKRVAAFDTRFSSMFVKIFGYAADKISDGLKKGYGDLALPSEGFYVKSTKGPLKEGEVERAVDWAKKLAK